MNTNHDDNQRKNILEWLSARGFPDAVRTLFVSILFALNLSPYLGGKTFWYLGASPVTIPSISADLFWIIVSVAPFLLSILSVRIVYAKIFSIIRSMMIALSVSIIAISINKKYPQIALESINDNFDKTYQINLIGTDKTLRVGHNYNNSNDIKGDYISSMNKICYFRTESIDLSNDIVNGTAFRISSVEINYSGFKGFDNVKRAGFDFETHIGNFNKKNEILQCSPIDNWTKDMTDISEHNDSKSSEVEGRLIIYTEESKDNNFRNKLLFDFEKEIITSDTVDSWQKEISRKDIYVKNSNDEIPKLQMAGWSLWRDYFDYNIVSLSVRVKGKRLSGFWL